MCHVGIEVSSLLYMSHGSLKVISSLLYLGGGRGKYILDLYELESIIRVDTQENQNTSVCKEIFIYEHTFFPSYIGTQRPIIFF